MRKLYITLLWGLFVATVCRAAHPYHPFVVEGKKWWCSEGVPDNIFIISGDSVYNNISYKKVLHVYPDLYDDNDHHNYAIVREEGKKVYIVFEGEREEVLLYDFSLGIITRSVEIANGECYISKYARNISTQTCLQSDWSFCGDEERRYVVFRSSRETTPNNFDSSTIIEGIGMKLHPFRPYGHVLETGNVDYEIEQVEENGKIILTGGDWYNYSYNYFDFLRGDVNGDKIIDVEDINAVINYFLGCNNSEAYDDVSADCDNNQIIDVDDVNALINIILDK